jgi:DNA-binding protein YbaB
MITGWESADVLYATVTDTLRRYADQIATQRLTIGRIEDGVTVVIGVDGYLASVEIENWVRRRYDAAQVAEFVADAVRRAEVAADERRHELAAGMEY